MGRGAGLAVPGRERVPKIVPGFLAKHLNASLRRIGEDVSEVAAIVQQVRDVGLLDRVGVDVAGTSAIVEALEGMRAPIGLGTPGSTVISCLRR